MSSYKVMVEGANFMLPNESGKKGFFSTFLILNSDLDGVNKKVEALLKDRIIRENIVSFDGFFGSQVLIDAIYEVESSKQVEGFTFFDMTFLGQVTISMKIMYIKIFSSKKLLNIEKKINIAA